MRVAWVLTATIMLAACVGHTGRGGIVIPPAEIDVGVGAPIGAAVDSAGPSTEVLAGLSWASLAWKPTPLDIGFGYVGSFRELDRRAIAKARGEMSSSANTLHIHGGYLQFGTTLANQRHWRTWFAARGELLRAYDGSPARSALGGALRIATELYASGKSTGRNGILAGTLAIGFYVEATYRDLPPELAPHGFTTGVTLRLPFLVVGS